jgi:hypothetical protein
MRTSLDLNEALLAEARRIAAEQHTSFKAVVEDALRCLIAARRQRLDVVEWPVSQRARPVPGVDLANNASLAEASEAP